MGKVHQTSGSQSRADNGARQAALVASLRQSEERFARAFDAAPIPTCISELATGVLIDINQAFLSLSGFTRDELIGKSMIELGAWPNAEVRARALETLKKGPFHNVPVTLKSKHGKVVHGLLSLQIFNVDGMERGLFSCVDVTDSVEAEQALRASESKYRTLVEQASDGILLANGDGHFQDANQAACEMLGYTREEMLGLTIEDTIDPAGLELAPRGYGELSTGQRVMIERNMRRKDGTVFPAEISARLLLGGNLQAIFRDITERKRIEDDLRVHAKLLDQVQAAVIAIDMTGKITHWNHYAEVLAGWSPEEAIGSNAKIVMFEDAISEAAVEVVAAAMSMGKWEGEFLVHRRDGSTFPAYLVATSMRNAHSEPTGVVGVFVDITDRKANEQKLMEHAVSQTQLLRRLIYAEEAERRRLSLELHDGALQSLGVALMAVDRAMRRYERGEGEIALKELQFLRTNLAGTVGEIRAVLADLSQEVLTTYGLGTALAGHVERFIDVTGINTEMSNNVTRRLPADIELLVYRLAQEALSNIRKHSNAQNVRITLQILGSTLYLKISDDGDGFDVESVLSRYEDGKHLGLKSMRERVQAAGGDLAIAASPGKGTLIEFRCPVPPREQTLTFLSDEDLIPEI